MINSKAFTNTNLIKLSDDFNTWANAHEIQSDQIVKILEYVDGNCVGLLIIYKS